jgi:hypothetical protein
MWQEMNIHDVSESQTQRYELLRDEMERRASGQEADSQRTGLLQAIREWLGNVRK